MQQLDSIALTADAEPNGSKLEPIELSEDESEADDRVIGSRVQPARLDPSRTAAALSVHAARKRKAIEHDSEDETLELEAARLRRCSRALIEDDSTNEHGEGSSASFEQGDSASLDGYNAVAVL